MPPLRLFSNSCERGDAMRILQPDFPEQSETDNDEPASGFIGWLVHRRPPGERLDHVVVTDPTGAPIANRPLPYGTMGSRGWDITLRQLGFRRVSAWQPTVGGFTCQIEVADAQSAATTDNMIS